MKTIEERFSVSFSYPVVFCRNLFGVDNDLLCQLLERESPPRPQRTLVVLARSVARAPPPLPARTTARLVL